MPVNTRIAKPYKIRDIPGPKPHSFAVVAKPCPKGKRINKGAIDAQRKDDMIRWKIEQDKEYRKQFYENELEKYSERIIKNAILKRQLAGLMKYEEFDINDRRERLKDLLEKEDAEYIEEMGSKHETMLERQAKMRARAKTLKDKREAERLAFVQEKYDQKFRNECEDVRNLLAERRKNEVFADRVEQMRMKDEMSKHTKGIDKLYDELWLKDMEEKAKKEEEVLGLHKERCREALVGQQKQMAALQEKRAIEKKLKEEEAQLMREQKAILDMEDLKNRENTTEKCQKMRDMLDSAIMAKIKTQDRLKQEDLAFDLKTLESLQQASSNEDAWTKQRKMELRDEDMRYRQYLQDMSELEQKRDKEINELIQADVDKIEQKKIDKYLEEQDKRRKLLRDVLAIRDEQIKHRLEVNKCLQAETNAETDLIKKQIEENRKIEALEKVQRIENKNKYKSDLENQMAYNLCLQDAERRRQIDEVKAEQLAEEEYQLKVMEAMNTPETVKGHPISVAILNQYGKSIEPKINDV